MPVAWVKPPRRQLPCPQCRRVLLDDLGQAVVCQSSRDEIAYFYCRACENRWALPVVSAD